MYKNGYVITAAFCDLCDNTCKTCENHSYECTSCNDNYFLLGT